MKKQESLTMEILHSAQNKQKVLAMALSVSLIANVILIVMTFIKK